MYLYLTYSGVLSRYRQIGNLSLCVVSVGAETVSIEPGIYIKLQWLSNTCLESTQGPGWPLYTNGHYSVKFRYRLDDWQN